MGRGESCFVSSSLVVPGNPWHPLVCSLITPISTSNIACRSSFYVRFLMCTPVIGYWAHPNPVEPVLVTQSCLTLCDLWTTRLLCHEILQARMLEWVAISSSRGSSQPRNQIQVSQIAGQFFTISSSREVPNIHRLINVCIYH